MSDEKKVVDSDEWKKELSETKLFDLPSGKTVRIKTKLNIVDFAFSGKMPLDLILESMSDIASSFDSTNRTMNPTNISSMSNMINAICISAFVEPVLSDDASEQGIDVNLIPMVDRIAVFSEVIDMKGAEHLRPFRAK